MTAIVGSIEVILSTNYDAYNSAMRNAASSTEQHTNRMNKAVQGTASSISSVNRAVSGLNLDAFRSLSYSALHATDNVDRLKTSMLAVVSLAGGFAGAFAVKGLVETADAYTNIQNKIRVITDDAKERVSLEKQLFDSANRTRTSLEDTTKLYSRMDMAVGHLFTTQEKMRFVETVQKSFAVSGMTPGEQSSNILEITHGIDSGRIQARTLRPLLMENVALGRQLANIMSGGDISKLRDMAEAGEISSDKFVHAIIQAGDAIDKQFKGVIPTVASSLTVLNNAWTRYIGMQDQSMGASRALSNGILMMAENMHTLGDSAIQVGTILAGLFMGKYVGGKVGGAIGSARDMIGGVAAERQAALAAAQAQAQAAREARAIAVHAADQASARRGALQDMPRFAAADPKAQSAWQKQQATVDSIQEAIKAADEKQSAALMKRAALETQVGQASESTLRRQATAYQALAAEKEKVASITQRVAAAEQAMNAGGGNVSRGQMGRFYGAMGSSVDMRDQFATAEANLARAKGIAEKLNSALAGASDRGRPLIENSLKRNAEAQAQFTAEKIAAGRALQAAEREFAEVEASIVASQEKQQQRLTQAYLREVSAREGALTQMSAATARAAAADEAVEASRLRAHQANMAAMARAESEAAAARASGNSARGALGPAQAGLAQARQAVGQSATSNIVGAVEAEAAAAARATSTHFALAEAQGAVTVASVRASKASIALGAAMTAIGSAGSSLMAFLGGPWGAALTAVGVGLALWEVAEQRAAAKERDHQAAVEALTISVKNYNDAIQHGGGGFNSSQMSDMAITAAKVHDSIDAITNSLRAQVVTSQESSTAMANGYMAAKTVFDDLPPSIQKVAEGVLDGSQKFDDLKTAVEDLIAQNPGLARQAEAVLKIARAGAAAQAAMQGAAQAARDLASAVSNVASVGGFMALESGARREKGEKEDEKVFDYFTKGNQAKRVNDMKAAGDKHGASLEGKIDELRTLRGGVDPTKDEIAQLDKYVTAEERAAEASKKGHKARHPRKTDAQKQDEKVTNYEQNADVAMLDKFSQKLVSAAQSAKFTDDQIQALINHLKSGNKDFSDLSENMQRLVKAEQVLDDAKWAREKLDAAKTSAEKYREEIEKLNRATERGTVTPEQAKKIKGNLDENTEAYQATKQNVDKLMQPLEHDLLDRLEGNKKAFKNFWKEMADTALQAALDPVWKAVSKMISNAISSMLGGGGIGSGGSSGGGFFGFLGGLFGGGGKTSSAIFHSGGIVGGSSVSRSVSSSLFVGAPRFHSGLTSGEFPAILQQGEHVLTAAQAGRTAATVQGLADAVGATRAGQAPNVEQHFHIAGAITQSDVANMVRAGAAQSVEHIQRNFQKISGDASKRGV